MNNISKGKLIEKLAKKSDLKCSMKQCKTCVDAFLNEIYMSLKKGDRVQLLDFGSFSINKRKARMGVNPQTGKPLKIPAKKTVKFTPSKNLKESVNK